jgi:hypothetical protein
MSHKPPSFELFFFQDGPCKFLTKEEQVVDQIAVELAIPTEWVNARDQVANPMLMAFSISELPTLVVRNRRMNRGVTTLSFRTITGPDLRNAARLLRTVKAYRDAQ